MHFTVKLNGVNSENCALLDCYAASSGNSLLMFWDSLSVQSSTDQSAVPKCRQGITSTHCIIAQKSAVLIYFTAEA